MSRSIHPRTALSARPSCSLIAHLPDPCQVVLQLGNLTHRRPDSTPLATSSPPGGAVRLHAVLAKGSAARRCLGVAAMREGFPVSTVPRAEGNGWLTPAVLSSAPARTRYQVQHSGHAHYSEQRWISGDDRSPLAPWRQRQPRRKAA